MIRKLYIWELKILKMTTFRENAEELTRLIINRWERDKEFEELVQEVEDFLVDYDSEHYDRKKND